MEEEILGVEEEREAPERVVDMLHRATLKDAAPTDTACATTVKLLRAEVAIEYTGWTFLCTNFMVPLPIIWG